MLNVLYIRQMLLLVKSQKYTASSGGCRQPVSLLLICTISSRHLVPLMHPFIVLLAVFFYCHCFFVFLKKKLISFTSTATCNMLQYIHPPKHHTSSWQIQKTFILDTHYDWCHFDVKSRPSSIQQCFTCKCKKKEDM